MSRLFEDSFGTTYDAANGKYVSALFGQKASSPNGNIATMVETNSYIPWNFGSIAGLEQAADLTVLGNMNDCAECHVGGGAMEYIPKYLADAANGSSYGGTSDPTQRVSLRSAGTAGGLLDTIFTSFNYLIDVFGPKGDGKGATYGAIKNDFAQSGVLEMDCFSCHLEGYDWEARKHAVRAMGFDASRVTGAGFGTYSTGRTPSTLVKYDPSILVGSNALGWKLAPVVAAKIAPVPPSENCATCHAATLKTKYQVEWKKRGDFWGGSEVHSQIGCMGCHERSDLNVDGSINKANVGTSGVFNANSKKLGLCDPAKGGDSDYDAQANAIDKVAFKNCADCHIGGANLANGKTYGAPNPTDKHALYGLTAKIAQKGVNGVANASHMDILDCTVCHALKNDVTAPLYKADGTFRKYTTFPITGGAMVDGTGKDHEGRLATHDTVNVEREMKDNYSLYWKNGKLFMGSFLTSFFWRDQNTGYDANKDLRGPGLDPILTTHVAKINAANGLEAITHDGVVTPAEITTMQTAIKNGLPALNGGAAGIPVIRLSALAVPFKWTHNIAPGAQALGKNCADCHSATSKFLNGRVIIAPKTDFTYGSGQMVTYAKVNGSTMGTDFHPNVVNKTGDRSIALQIFNTAGGRLNDDSQAVSRAAMIYEGTTFKAPKTDYVSVITGSAISGWKTAATDDASLSAGTAGWTLKIEEKDVATSTVTPRTFSTTDNALTSVAGLITHMGGFATAYGFDITDGGASNLVITAKSGKLIRLAVQSSLPTVQTDCGSLGLTAAQYVNSPTIGVNGTSYADRAAWLGYFNSAAIADKAAYGIGLAPVADIATIGAQTALEGTTVLNLVKDASVNLVAANPATAGKFTYNWVVSDNSGVAIASTQTAAYTFPKEGIFYINLTVTDEEGLVSSIAQKVSVVAANPVTLTGTSTNATTKVTTLDVAISGTYDKVVFSWGDGTAATTTTAAGDLDGTITIAHKYLRFGMYAVADADLATAGNQPGYRYTTSVRVFNGTALIATKNVLVYALQ